jgi:DNA-binding NtrC family response regulator
MAAVLIAQAQTDERSRLLMTLQMAGHDAAEASDGATAVAMLEEKPFDVAVIDEELTDMFGSELVLALRNVRGYVMLPAVLLLPSCAEDAPQAESETPMPDVPAVYRVFKPSSCGEIQAAVEQALAEVGTEPDRRIVLEQRREVWGDVSALQRLARSIT